MTHLRFVEQATPKSLLARHSEKASGRTHESRRAFRSSLQLGHHDREPVLVGATSQLAIFVSFEKRAAIIRLSDASVQEVTLYEDPVSSNGSIRDSGNGVRPRANSDGFTHIPNGVWLPTLSLQLPPPPPIVSHDDREVLTLATICIVTKGKRTHVIRSPLPPSLSAAMPLVELRWEHPPTSISARIIPDQKNPDLRWEGVVQLLGFGPAGVEVLEIPVSSIRTRASSVNTARIGGDGADSTSHNPPSPLSSGAADPVPIFTGAIPEDDPASPVRPGKGKGKAKSLPVPPWDMPEPVRGYIDIGSDTVFLCRGGRWHEMMENGQPASMSKLTLEDIESRTAEQEEAARQLEKDGHGIYACAYRGVGDFKVFYVGDFAEGDVEPDND